jgi:hypothetical protein
MNNKRIPFTSFPWMHEYTPNNPIASLDRDNLPDETSSGVVEFQLLERKIHGNIYTETDFSQSNPYDIILDMSVSKGYELIFKYRDIQIILATSSDREVNFTYGATPLMWYCSNFGQYINSQVDEDLLGILLNTRESFINLQKKLNISRSLPKSERINIISNIASSIRPIINDLISFSEEFYSSACVR